MSHKTSFVYRDFYDVPRMIVLHRGDLLILLESAFEAETDDTQIATQFLCCQAFRRTSFKDHGKVSARKPQSFWGESQFRTSNLIQPCEKRLTRV